MSEPHPIMALLLEYNSFLGGAESVEGTMMPIQAQSDFGPGDAGILAMSNTPLEHDFTVVRGVDPAKHAETYPDWEERTELKSMVLCEIFSKADPLPHLGWIARVKVMPISNYRYRETRKWLKDGFPEEIPDWAEKYYRDFANQLAEQAPNVVPRSVKCPNCSSVEVELLVSRRIEYTSKVGALMIEEKERYIPINDPKEESSHYARLHCTGCDSYAELDDEEWELPSISY
jgi:hypothetical protein